MFDISFFILGVTLTLTSSLLSVIEGNVGHSSFNLCIEVTDIQTSLVRDVELILNTAAGEAGE